LETLGYLAANPGRRAAGVNHDPRRGRDDGRHAVN
jgi:hypothetical protein